MLKLLFDMNKVVVLSLIHILENVMTDIMFRIPSDETVCRVEITPGVVDGTGEPVAEHGERTAVPAEKQPPKKASRRKPTKSA